MAGFPLALQVLLEFASAAILPDGSDSIAERPMGGLIYTIPWTLFGVAVHRRILFDAPGSVDSSITWSSSRWAFATFLLFWQLPWLLVPSSTVESPISHSFMLAGMVVLAILHAHVAISLPSAAIDEIFSPLVAHILNTTTESVRSASSVRAPPVPVIFFGSSMGRASYALRSQVRVGA